MYWNLIIVGNFNMINIIEFFSNFIELGMYLKEKVDIVIVMEKIGYFLDDVVCKLYKKVKLKGFNKREVLFYIVENFNIIKILRKFVKNWDGGYVMVGLLGYGDFFVLRDFVGICFVYFYKDDEIVVVVLERFVI